MVGWSGVHCKPGLHCKYLGVLTKGQRTGQEILHGLCAACKLVRFCMLRNGLRIWWMQCSLDKHEACSCFQVGDLVFVEELAQEPVWLEQLALLRESHQLEAALHAVPVQELVQGQTLSQELSLDVLLAGRLEDHFEADLWAKKRAIAVLYPRCEERNPMLGFDLTTPDA